jgi:hypothetical protein
MSVSGGMQLWVNGIRQAHVKGGLQSVDRRFHAQSNRLWQAFWRTFPIRYFALSSYNAGSHDASRANGRDQPIEVEAVAYKFGMFFLGWKNIAHSKLPPIRKYESKF